ncbi:unnamed protein product [Prorocentrum cordatum]|uniref:Uncharacterized protein n=1 Tax=Prorocentrum cordatum TaxID=2364126 RepID=A0ABN9TGJ0_9DINO|nr:unnamed protein product [Polarella glacialis]
MSTDFWRRSRVSARAVDSSAVVSAPQTQLLIQQLRHGPPRPLQPHRASSLCGLTGPFSIVNSSTRLAAVLFLRASEASARCTLRSLKDAVLRLLPPPSP